MDRYFVLIHSPLVGSFTWLLVAHRLRQRGIRTYVPVLDEVEGGDTPYWQQHVEVVARAVQVAAESGRPILVGHSGSGPLLPVIARRIGGAVAGYIFVDAGLPHGGMSRLDAIEANAPGFGAELRRHLVSAGRSRRWSDEDVRDIIPDDHLRQALLAELRPRSLTFFEEPLPDVAGWPYAGSAYLQFSPVYDGSAEQARQARWPCYVVAAGHFHMLVDPEGVRDALVELAQELDSHRG